VRLTLGYGVSVSVIWSEVLCSTLHACPLPMPAWASINSILWLQPALSQPECLEC
jgi:hypothetical protein